MKIKNLFETMNEDNPEATVYIGKGKRTKEGVVIQESDIFFCYNEDFVNELLFYLSVKMQS